MKRRILAVITVLSILMSFSFSVSAADIPGWKFEKNYSPNISYEIDTDLKGKSDPCLHILSNQPLKKDVYLRITTSMNLEGGKTYIYGISEKANKASGVTLYINWDYKTNMLPLGSTCDWTEVGKTFTPASSGKYSMAIIIENKGELWLDDAFCYEYRDGKKIGNNLIANYNFSGGDVSQSGTKESNVNNENISSLAESISVSTQFAQKDLEKTYGGRKFFPAYPADGNITVDGIADEWDKYPPIKLPTLDSQYYSYNQAERDAYGYFRFAYDDENLYMVAEMHDNIFHGVNGTESYWMCDTIQLALSKFNETYGKELTFGIDPNGMGKIYGGDDSVELKVSQNNDKTVSIYEVKIPWKFSYGEKPSEDMLITALYNDNDDHGRAYCQEWSPGISEGKYNTKYPHLRLVEWDDDLAWFEGEKSAQVGTQNRYSFYYVNTSDEAKTVDISIPCAAVNNKLTVGAHMGTRFDIYVNPEEMGVYDLDAFVTENGGETVSVHQNINVEPNISVYNDEYFKQIDANVKELEALMQKCTAMGLSTDYEKINVNIIKRYKEDLKSLLSDDKTQLTKIVYTAECLEKLYKEALDNMNAYMSGEKESYFVPMYTDSKVEVIGNSVWADTKTNDGKTQRRPVFFNGVGHFATASGDIENLTGFGFNIIQQEMGIKDIIKEPGTISAWKINSTGSYPVNISINSDEKGTGDYSAKISCANPAKAQNYKYLSQTVTVKPNTTYYWGLSAKGTNVGSQTWFSNSGWSNTKSLSGTYDWKNFEYKFKTGENQTKITLMIMFADKVDELYIDDIYLKESSKAENLLLNGGFEDNAPIIGDFCVDADAVQSMADTLKKAEENNVSVCLLLSPHYFPEYLKKLYPEISAVASHFIKYDVMNQKAREATEMYLRTVIPIVSQYDSLGSICLSNEPQNTGKYEQMAPWWHAWLREKYNNDIDALRAAHKVYYNDFETVPVSGSADNSQAVNLAVDWEWVEEETDGEFKYTQNGFSRDWNEFNDEMFAEWHTFMADIIRELAPDIPLHTKVMSHDTNTGLETSDGTDYYRFSLFSDINGNDAWQVYNPDTSKTTVGPGGVTYHHKSVMYDQQRSTKTAPIFNTEDHIMRDGEKDWSFNHGIRVFEDMWQGAIHGRVGSTIWLWEKTNDQASSFYGLIHSRPDCIRSVGYSTYHLNRLAYEVTAFQDAEPTVGIIRSKVSRVYTEAPSTFYAHSAALFAGQKVDAITEDMISNIHNHKLLILPELTNVSQQVFEEIEKYVNNGGKVLAFGENLLAFDDYNNPYPSERVNAVLEKCRIVPTPDKADETWWNSYCDIVRNAVKDAGLMNIEVVYADSGEPAFEVEWESAEYDGRLLVNLCNYTWDVTKEVKILVDGKEVTSSKDLISQDKFENVITLENYTPRLIEIE